MSQKGRPWRRRVLLSAIFLAVIGASVFAGWLLATPSSPSYPPATTKTFPDQTVNVTIPGNVLNPGPGQTQTPDNADKVPPDQPGVVSVVIPGAAFEKLAPARELWVHGPSPSFISTWGPVIVGTLAALSGFLGVVFTLQQKDKADLQKDKADKRSEWWRRTAWALERTFSEDEGEAELGWKVISTLVTSDLATEDDDEMVQVLAEEVALGISTVKEDSDGNAAAASGEQTPGA